ncbi:hypothetical protein [Thermospira aquatica]|uniref:Outer membrane protein beta-barrel domain-containing protein n=1 Tax=Thermospira aquatica TaxID=2828656 RepID=A0AAX3BD57_9SPIR|nr:hypothetical protein [Thermospira aquatica]URA09954.1 hypothetical protein KDW03_10810 [Thermospira aquatica]
MRKYTFLILFLGISLASLMWGKTPRLEVGLSPTLAIFGDAIGGGSGLYVDYPLLHLWGISWPVKTRGVFFFQTSGNPTASYTSVAFGGGIAAFYALPDLSALSFEGGCDILPSWYMFSFTTDKGKGSQSGMGVILAPYAAAKYALSLNWGMRFDISYHIGLYDTFYGYIILSLGGSYAF